MTVRLKYRNKYNFIIYFYLNLPLFSHFHDFLQLLYLLYPYLLSELVSNVDRGLLSQWLRFCSVELWHGYWHLLGGSEVNHE